MSELDFRVGGWVASDCGDAVMRATTGSLRISAGEGLRIPVTEVEDTVGMTVRPHIYVPLSSMAEWLLVNWWRLRWEARPSRPKTAWRQAHCFSGIGGDTPWPPLEVSSDGDFIHLHMVAEESPDVSAIRYLRHVLVELAASEFEAAVDRFLDVVQSRLSSVLPSYGDINELREELAEERRRSSLARECRWQALAGIDPGDAPEGWLLQAETLSEDTGALAGDEVMGVLPELEDGIQTAASLIEAMRQSATSVDLSWVSAAPEHEPASTGERPWQRGVRLAHGLRKAKGLGSGPLDNKVLSELVSTPVPLPGQPIGDVALGGGFRNGVSGGRAHILVASRHTDSQRFFLARMIGAAHVLPQEEHLVPVTRGDSALQKLERSFAQELLCPWASLDAFTDEHGVHDEALAEAAEYFQVSEWLVRATLVNRGKLSRQRLPGALV